MDKVVKSLEKIGRFLGDARLWTYLIGLVVMFGVIPAVVDTQKLGTDMAEAILLIVQGVTSLLSTVILLYSMTQHEPTGLDNVPKEVTEVAEQIFKAIKE